MQQKKTIAGDYNEDVIVCRSWGLLASSYRMAKLIEQSADS
jgi:hypothetical protein